MAGPQSTVNFVRALGVPGELAYTGPVRSKAGILHSASAAYNIIGATAFTLETAADDQNPNAAPIVKAGGTGPFYGILANPKVYASFGTSNGGPLAPTLTLPNALNAEFVDMGELVVTVPAACNVGDLVYYDTTTGAIGTVPKASSFTGVIAGGGNNTLTVSGFVAGGPPLGIGTVISGTGVAVGTTIVALGTGTGGNGTYTVSPAGAVSSTTMAGDAKYAPSGKSFVPNAVVEIYSPTGAGLAVIKLTN